MKLVPFSTGAHFRRSGLWIRPVGLSEAATSLDAPDSDAEYIDDLKRWVMVSTGSRSYYIGPKRRVVSIDSRTAMRKFIGHVLADAQLSDLGGRTIWFLLPADDNDERRQNLKRALASAIEDLVPGGAPVRFLFEPEMSAEYFRLLQGTITIQPGRVSAFLVVDCGASTCDLTMVFTTKEGQLSKGSTGRSRGRLQAVTGSARMKAGRWVDDQLLKKMWKSLQSTGASRGSNRRYLFERTSLIEHLKVAVSAREEDMTLVNEGNGVALSLEVGALRGLCRRLWDETYKRDVDALFDRAFHQLSKTAWGGEQIRAAGVTSSRDMSRIVAGVILAGGTSRLPGFEECLRSSMNLPPEVPVVRPGMEYPAVAALGALAHVLDRSGSLVIRAPSTPPGEVVDAGTTGEIAWAIPEDIVMSFPSESGGAPLGARCSKPLRTFRAYRRGCTGKRETGEDRSPSSRRVVRPA